MKIMKYFKKWIKAGINKVKYVLYEVKGFIPLQGIVDEIEESGEDVDKSIVKQQFEKIKQFQMNGQKEQEKKRRKEKERFMSF